MKKYAFIGFHIIFCISFCRSQVELEGNIIDSLSGNPIPFPTIIVENTPFGTIGREDGSFQLKVKDSLLGNSILVTCLGYIPKRYSTSFFSSNNIVVLNHNPIKLPEIAINSFVSTSVEKIIRVGSKNKKRNDGFFFETGWEVALFIPYYQLNSFLKKIRFYITNEGIPNSKFRAKIYSPKEDGSPGILLVDTNIVLQANKGNEWVEYDVSIFNILLPQKGVFIALEWLPNSEAYNERKNNSISFRGSGQVLGATKLKQPYSTWVRPFVTAEWKKISLNAAIGADLITY